MTLPHISLKYSKIYDLRWREVFTSQTNYPTEEQTKAYITNIEPLWRKEEDTIVNQLSEITKLTWEKQIIDCYVVGGVKPFSDPLTVPIFENDHNRFIDTLTHELIHQLFIQNRQRLQHVWTHMHQKYSNETTITRTHIILLAIQSKLILTLHDQERLTRNIERMKKNGAHDYIRSLMIVEEEGYKTILDNFISKLIPTKL